MADAFPDIPLKRVVSVIYLEKHGDPMTKNQKKYLKLIGQAKIISRGNKTTKISEKGVIKQEHIDRSCK